ncbi:MAG: glycosyltransferase [Phycisphaerales bacterium]|nr:glycosyltransferase [Phycisphaerales bacterium]
MPDDPTHARPLPAAEAPSAGSPVPGGHLLTRLDAHVHSWASDGPAVAALGLMGVPECYSPPEKVYDQAKARGMDLVTITDHDTVKGAMELVERGFQGFIVGEEVTVYFPEDRCKLHVLVWGLTPAKHEDIAALGLRDDVYAFARWLREQNLAHSLAHPLYVQNGRLAREHVEKCALLFKCFEIVNGAHSSIAVEPIRAFLDALTPDRIDEYAARYGFEPIWPRAWEKGRTGGSDDHGLLNIGRTWTELDPVLGTDGQPRKVTDPAEFMRRVMGGFSRPGGDAGHSSLLAHQFTTVGANFYKDRFGARTSTTGKAVASRLLRFAGIEMDKPSRKRMAVAYAKRRLLKRKKTHPLVGALRQSIGPVLEQYPDLRDRLRPDEWTGGAAISQHDRMASFIDDLLDGLRVSLAPGARRSLARRDKAAMIDHIAAYAMVEAAQLPYIYSLFHQNKERVFIEKFTHDISSPGSGASVLERPMRVLLFTDTLGDVNGVTRFIYNMADIGARTGRDLQVVTSTNFPVAESAYVHNFKPIAAGKMPKYENLEFVLPPATRILRFADKHQPDAIHISTPGPIGLVGFLTARMLRVPVLGVYHTDFPAYIDNLFEDPGMTFLCQKAMRAFYKPFQTIFTRSKSYIQSLGAIGLDERKIVALKPGVDTTTFSPQFRTDRIWEATGVPKRSVKAIFVGRVSVEKNLPMLTPIWKQVHEECRRRGLDADLAIVGDGPYRARMQRDLRGCRAHFLGFRHGQELSELYASADMFLFPSITDTLGQVVMEAQAAGLPVLVTEMGGPKEVMEDGRTGHVLGHKNPEQWVDAIVGLIADNARRAEMSRAAIDAMQSCSLEQSFEEFWAAHEIAWRQHLATIGITPKSERQALVEVRDLSGVKAASV